MEITCTIKEAIPLLENYTKRGIPYILISQPGLGKSTLEKTIAKKLGYDLITVFAADKTPSDLNGYLIPLNGKIDFHPFGFLEKILNTKKPLKVFFDEATKAPQAVINAISQMVLDRQINNKPIPSLVQFSLAANRKGDLSNDNPLPEHLKSRLRIINLRFDLPSFNQYMIENNFHDDVIAFVNIYHEMLENWKPSRNEEASNVPRNIENLSNDIKAFESEGIEIKPFMLFPVLSSEYTYKFLELREIFQSLPNLDEIAAGQNPSISSLNPSACNLILVKLLNKINALTYENIFQWIISNLRIEQQKLFFELAKVNNQKYLDNSKIYTQWLVNNQGFQF